MRTAALIVLVWAVVACGGGERSAEQPAPAIPAWYRAGDCEVVGESEAGRFLRCFRGGRPNDHGSFVREDASGRHRVPVSVPRNPDGSKKQVVVGHWEWAALSPDGSTFLAEWSAECEVPIAYFVPAAGGVPRRVTDETADLGTPVESRALGWTNDGRAIVRFPKALGCGPLSQRPGVYLVGRDRDPTLIRADDEVAQAVKPSLAPRSSASLFPDRSFGYIRAVDASASPRTIDFDVADFLTGERANRAAAEDGVVEPGEPVTNDYYVRNREKTVETLPVARDARVTAVRCPDGCTEGNPGDLDDLFASFAITGDPPSLEDDYRGASTQYWVTLENGVVVAIDEQYVP
jgi:hypothetical protein